jgi:hypothetical protein
MSRLPPIGETRRSSRVEISFLGNWSPIDSALDATFGASHPHPNIIPREGER